MIDVEKPPAASDDSVLRDIGMGNSTMMGPQTGDQGLLFHLFNRCGTGWAIRIGASGGEFGKESRGQRNALPLAGFFSAAVTNRAAIWLVFTPALTGGR